MHQDHEAETAMQSMMMPSEIRNLRNVQCRLNIVFLLGFEL